MTTDVTPYQNQELVSRGPAPALDLAIATWLDSKAGRSGSGHTEKIYRSTVADFRAEVQRAGLDLDADPRAIATAAGIWAGRNTPAPATFNRRLAVLSSFYTFARRRGMLEMDNPIGLVERRPVQSYANTEAIRPADIKRKLASIDRSTLEGQRDYCLLAVALATGRRLAEVAGLRLAHVLFDGELIRLHFPRAKGGKVMSDVLPLGVSRALTIYLHALYGVQLGAMPAHLPIWVALSRNRPGRPQLSVRSLEDICKAHIGCNFHKLRNTFAQTMESTGAKVSDIQARLGHSSLATTGRYLAALSKADNPHIEAIAKLLGL
jgi:integrase/recombinase XerD